MAQHYTIEVLTDERATALTWNHSGGLLPAQQPDRLGRGEPVAHLHHSHRRGSGVSLPEVRTGSAPHLSSQAGALGRPPVPDVIASTGAGHPQTPQAAGRPLVGCVLKSRLGGDGLTLGERIRKHLEVEGYLVQRRRSHCPRASSGAANAAADLAGRKPMETATPPEPRRRRQQFPGVRSQTSRGAPGTVCTLKAPQKSRWMSGR